MMLYVKSVLSSSQYSTTFVVVKCSGNMGESHDTGTWKKSGQGRGQPVPHLKADACKARKSIENLGKAKEQGSVKNIDRPGLLLSNIDILRPRYQHYPTL